ncbi:class I SAM-dependent rRNA methyltransferase [Roseomonas sp. CECT 9278]|uniref:class I SAM-dependent rRNA methyltransferase n=1 Tax=Roseomonas sp. CECT 9278 TaxID=2845823 RepID=UPI001E44554E|nr:class I SAM-dependent rRNA methyltransferase [Roseomonas sp. CECT 9278]CAH0239070.1 Ribosomal RNA large subunit methyltransferase I [Roseomonas sp. CECT 9278]
MPDRPILRLLPGRDRRVKAGHPWVFSNEIAMTPAARSLPAGSVVRIEGDDGVKHGAWHFNAHSLIAARRLSTDPDAACDAAWFRARLAEALALRERLFGAPHYRLVHAEADGLPGLVIDRYGDVVALQANTAGMEAATPMIVEALHALFAPRGIVARNDSAVRGLEGLAEETRLLAGDAAGATVEENGLRFPVDLVGGQKTGWFFDQREHRARVARLAAGATVLDAFCHTGGFGIGCAVAGAAQVTLLDRSEHALATAMQAAAANNVADRVTAQRGEAMDMLERMVGEGRRFGVVVADPPAFAKARRDQPAALRAYGKLARLAATLTERGGFLFIASCSHHVAPGEFAEAVGWGVHRASRQGRAAGEARILHMGGAGPDHPLHPMLPESAYLKGMLLHLP